MTFYSHFMTIYDPHGTIYGSTYATPLHIDWHTSERRWASMAWVFKPVPWVDQSSVQQQLTHIKELFEDSTTINVNTTVIMAAFALVLAVLVATFSRGKMSLSFLFFFFSSGKRSSSSVEGAVIIRTRLQCECTIKKSQYNVKTKNFLKICWLKLEWK